MDILIIIYFFISDFVCLFITAALIKERSDELSWSLEGKHELEGGEQMSYTMDITLC